MTSPVDTSVKYYSSLMSGAPVLSGTAGVLIALLDAVLKDGFDTKTLTSLVALGGVMTATWASGNHSSQTDAVVLVAGVTGGPSGFAGANGEQKIVSRPTNLTATWATALPDGTYTGTITMKMAPAGWLKPFAATNYGAYKSGDPASTGMLLRVDDSVATTARVVGYESMSDINTGVGAFPTNLQMSGGGYWAKSGTANATAVQWMLIADARGFILHVCPSFGASALLYQGFTRGFGDAAALRPGGDAFACFLSYSTSATATAQTDGQLDWGTSIQTAFPRAFTGLGSSVLHGSYPYTGSNTLLSGIDTSLGPFPSVVDGSLRLSKRYFATATGVAPRAELPGLYSIPQTLTFDSIKFGDRTPGTGSLAGRNLVAVNTTNSSSTSSVSNSTCGTTMIDITGPWAR
ncbi:hypothetical protein AB4142_19025 [Variovorax sp. 2RAF20]